MGLFNLFGLIKKKKNLTKEAEKLFLQGNILIITDMKDYVDVNEFIEKTKNIPSINKKLEELGF